MYFPPTNGRPSGRLEPAVAATVGTTTYCKDPTTDPEVTANGPRKKNPCFPQSDWCPTQVYREAFINKHKENPDGALSSPAASQVPLEEVQKVKGLISLVEDRHEVN